jgi:hypothetical protein
VSTTSHAARQGQELCIHLAQGAVVAILLLIKDWTEDLLMVGAWGQHASHRQSAMMILYTTPIGRELGDYTRAGVTCKPCMHWSILAPT